MQLSAIGCIQDDRQTRSFSKEKKENSPCAAERVAEVGAVLGRVSEENTVVGGGGTARAGDEEGQGRRGDGSND